MRMLLKRWWPGASGRWQTPGETYLLAVLGVVLFLFVVFLLVLHDKTQNDLRDAKKTEFVEEVSRRAEGLGFFFNDRRNDLDDLAMSLSLEAYFVNKDLGMSLRYGLQANLDEIARSMKRLVDTRRFVGDVQEIYRRVTLVDQSGNVLIDAVPQHEPIEPVPSRAQSLADFLNRDRTKAMVRFDGCPGDPAVVVLRPLIHKGRFVGQLIAWLRWGPMRVHQLSFGAKPISVALADSGGCVLYDTAKGGPQLPAARRLAAVPTGAAVTVNDIVSLDGAATANPVIEAAFPIRATPFRFVAAMTAPDLFAGNTSSWLVGALYTLTFLLFISGLVMWRSSLRRNRLQNDLREAQKLEAVGQLAGGIAHEINTPSQYIGNNLKFLADAHASLFALLTRCLKLIDSLGDQPALAEPIREIDALRREVDLEFLAEEVPLATEQSIYGIDQIARIVLAMKEFSHPGVEEKVPADLNRAIENTITISRNEWKHVANVETDLDAALPAVFCRPGEITQVLLNLLVNAAHAIRAAGRGAGEGRIGISTAVEGNNVTIRVEDNGTGIADSIRDKIFHPFFTTKEVGKGTGQGLAIARDIVVNKHGGSIRFETRAGRGTTFIVTLPLRETFVTKTIGRES